MILSDKGNVSFHGNGIELLADLSCAVDELSKQTGVSVEKLLEVINASLNDYSGEAEKDETYMC